MIYIKVTSHLFFVHFISKLDNIFVHFELSWSPISLLIFQGLLWNQNHEWRDQSISADVYLLMSPQSEIWMQIAQMSTIILSDTITMALPGAGTGLRGMNEWDERGWHYWSHLDGDMVESLYNIDGLVQERRNSSVSAVELRLSCTNPLIWYVLYTIGNLTFYHNYWVFKTKFLDIYIASPFELNFKEIPKFLEIGIVGIIIFVSLKRHNERLNLIMEIYVMTDQYLLNGVIPLARRFGWWGSYYFSNKGHTIVKIGKVK